MLGPKKATAEDFEGFRAIVGVALVVGPEARGPEREIIGQELEAIQKLFRYAHPQRWQLTVNEASLSAAIGSDATTTVAAGECPARLARIHEPRRPWFIRVYTTKIRRPNGVLCRGQHAQNGKHGRAIFCSPFVEQRDLIDGSTKAVILRIAVTPGQGRMAVKGKRCSWLDLGGRTLVCILHFLLSCVDFDLLGVENDDARPNVEAQELPPQSLATLDVHPWDA